MSRHIDDVLALIDGALSGGTSQDSMRWTPNRPQPPTGAPSVTPATIDVDALDALCAWILDTFADVARQIVAAFNQIADSPAWVELVALAERLTADTPDPNRVRHGSAAICPKHGQTRGGLCRRCAR